MVNQKEVSHITKEGAKGRVKSAQSAKIGRNNAIMKSIIFKGKKIWILLFEMTNKVRLLAVRYLEL